MSFSLMGLTESKFPTGGEEENTDNGDPPAAELVEISFHDSLGKSSDTNNEAFGYNTRMPRILGYYPFTIGDTDLDIKWLASLNTIQANWKEMLAPLTTLNSMDKQRNHSFQGCLGRDLLPFYLFVPRETCIVELEEQLITDNDMLKLLRANLLKAQSRIKAQDDSKRRELSFDVGDPIFLRVQPYRQKSAAKKKI
ncbi:hypothetical protein ACH5RR_023496 [Cinchona calisaya]|uniref:Uncharacterized protein n=1 Tax=Cinchona calisaya TaxID=153742 RepID=A0ABD2ZCD1_9GENT